ncbi:Uncharacterised protein [Klebsiella pneumoniae]|nr:Uncharacterised protein [Klebsiella pneumoniae]VFZ57750.1 Uncharacterised protein [Klebsiella pneumoniae]VGC96092.1 Uncharacterised protein [Klebsiella pneumoniae]VGI27181.1 Uncharacterised protein [Klebsiella pneumoniae]
MLFPALRQTLPLPFTSLTKLDKLNYCRDDFFHNVPVWLGYLLI